MSDETATSSAPSVHRNAGRSVIIRHTVHRDHRDRYETWLRQIIQAASQFPGHQGVHIVRPTYGNDTFVIAVRFSSGDDAETWLHSDIR